MLRFALAGSLAACTSPGTSLDVHYDAELRDDTLTLTVQLSDPDPLDGGPYHLGPGDSLGARFRGHDLPVKLDHDANGIAIYTATLTPDPTVAADEPIRVTFEQGDNHIELTATATPDFALQAPASSPQPVTVTWSPTAADRIRWASSSASVPAADGAIQVDSGQLVFPPGVLASTPLSSATTVTIDVARTRAISPNTSWGPIPVEFSRWNTVTVEVTP